MLIISLAGGKMRNTTQAKTPLSPPAHILPSAKEKAQGGRGGGEGD